MIQFAAGIRDCIDSAATVAVSRHSAVKGACCVVIVGIDCEIVTEGRYKVIGVQTGTFFTPFLFISLFCTGGICNPEDKSGLMSQRREKFFAGISAIAN